MFDDLDCGSEFSVFGIGEEEVDVIRHEDVAVNLEFVFLAGFFEDFLEGVAGGWSFKDVAVAVTTNGDEVEVSSSVSTVETFWHWLSLEENWGSTEGVVEGLKATHPFR